MPKCPRGLKAFAVEAFWKNGGAYPWLVLPKTSEVFKTSEVWKRDQANIEEPRGLGVCPRRAAISYNDVILSGAKNP
jgi:hypothetical protein